MKKLKIIFLITCCLTLFFNVAFSQVFTGRLQIKHFTGKIKTMPIDLTVKKQGDTLTGIYFYEKFGVPIKLKGKISKDGIIELNEVDKAGDPTATFVIKLDPAKKIKGTWQRKGAKDKIPVELTEDYTGVVKFEPVLYQTKVPLLKMKKEPAYSIDLFYLQPVDFNNKNALTEINKTCSNSFFAKYSNPTKPALSLKTMADSLIPDYKSSASTYDSTFGASFNWAMDCSADVYYNKNNLLTYSSFTYSFSGGAHGIYGTSYIVVDCKTGKQLKLSDIFNKGFEKELDKKITGKAEINAKLKKGQKLTSAGYLADDIKTTDNFYVNGGGIGFVYNVEEIAPYVNGTIDIFLSYKEIETLLKKDSPVSQFVTAEEKKTNNPPKKNKK